MLERLDGTSFAAVFHHVRHIIDFNRTRYSPDPSMQHGFYFIKTVFINPTLGLLDIYASERRLNTSTEPDQDGTFNVKGKPGTKGWENDATLRNRLRDRFEAWDLLEEFKYIDGKSFAKLAPEIAPPPAAQAAIDAQSARRELILVSIHTGLS